MQQIVDRLPLENYYVSEADVIFDRRHVLRVQNSSGNVLMPDFEIRLPDGKAALLALTIPNEDGKIFKYSTQAVPEKIPYLIDITY